MRFSTQLAATVATVAFALTQSAAAQMRCRPGMACGPPPIAAGRAAAPSVVSHPAVVRVENDLGGQSSLGSGTLIEKDSHYGWILTCAHLFSDGVGRVSAYFPAANHRYYAKVFAVDRKHDLALLLIRTPQAPNVQVAQDRPQPGEQVTWHGFGQGTYRAASGTAAQPVSLDGGKSWNALQWHGAARQGDSGGPALNARGQLVAVISGSDGQASVGSDCIQIRSFLSDCYAKLQPKAPSVEPSADAPLVAVPKQPAQSDRVDQRLAELQRQLAALAEQLQQSRAASCPCPALSRGDEADARPAADVEAVLEQVLAKLPRENEAELKALTARLAALEAAYEGQVRYRLRRVPVAQVEE